MNATQLKPLTSSRPAASPRWLLLACLACGDSPEGVLFADRAGSAAASGPRLPPAAASPDPTMAALAAPLQPTSSSSAPPAQSNGAPAPGQSSVLWSSPAQDEAGVREDREVVLQFSEAMNIASVEAAVHTTLPGRLAFSWEGGGSLLRLRASERLAYAEGLAASPLEFQVGIGSGAHALSGAPLAPSSVTFRTLRRIELLLEPSDDPELTGVALSAAERPDAGAATPCPLPGSLCAGDLPTGSGEWLQVKSFLSYDLTQLPREAELERARLRLVVEELVGNPFGSRGLGNLHAERSWFSQIDPEAFRADPDATLAVLANGDRQTESGDITWVIQEARERGVTQYRLTFPQTTNRDEASDLAVLVPRRQRLQLSYLIP